MDNLIDTIESQYANSPRIMALIDSFNESVDPSNIIDEFYTKIWDILTAEGAGLDIWGRIVVVDRVVRLLISKEYFWWDEAGASSNLWDSKPWFRSISDATENYYLSDNAFRLAILTKAMANISDGSIYRYNRMLMTLFPNRGNVYVVDNHDMTITIMFKFKIEKYEEALLQQSGVFPSPCAQKVSIVQDYSTEMRYETEMLDGLEMK